MRRTPAAFIAFAAMALLLGARTRPSRPPAAEPLTPVDFTRALEITDKPIVGAFSLDRILAQLIARSGVAGLTPQQMMRQMFDTQNPAPGLADPGGPHCDDFQVDGQPAFNGFPRRCPTPEATLGATPYASGEYFTLGIANRFDLAPADGSNCGQYRIIVAHKEPTVLTVLHLIFEAVLPNPHPEQGLAACRPVAQFLYSLGGVESMERRRALLETFYFQGLAGFGPVIDAANFTEPGGIRTIQQSTTAAIFRFYQFRLAKQCDSGNCTLRFTPDVVENQLFGPMFDARAASPKGEAFRDEFVKHVQTLAVRDVNLFHMHIPKEFLLAESNPLDSDRVFRYKDRFQEATASPQGAAFSKRIQAELDRVGSTLTPEQIVFRAEGEGCVGCHTQAVAFFGEDVKFIGGFLGAPMISDEFLADGEAGPQTRYGVDPIVVNEFMPHRMQILIDFLQSGKAPEHSK